MVVDAWAILVQALREEEGWVRVHAAETLIALGSSTISREAFLADLPALEASSVRIGAWRVLAASAATETERAAYVGKIEAVLQCKDAPDALQAIESLCKLQIPPTGRILALIRDITEGPEGVRPLAFWADHLAGDPTAPARIAELLGSTDPVVRLRAAYALRWIKPSGHSIGSWLANVAQKEPPDSTAFAYLLSATLVLNPDSPLLDVWLLAAARVRDTGTAAARFEICQALLVHLSRMTPADFLPLLEHPDADSRIGAAWVIIRSQERAET